MVIGSNCSRIFISLVFLKGQAYQLNVFALHDFYLSLIGAKIKIMIAKFAFCICSKNPNEDQVQAKTEFTM